MLLSKKDVNPTEDIGSWDLILINLIIKNVVVMINFKIIFKDFFPSKLITLLAPLGNLFHELYVFILVQ